MNLISIPYCIFHSINNKNSSIRRPNDKIYNFYIWKIYYYFLNSNGMIDNNHNMNKIIAKLFYVNSSNRYNGKKFLLIQLCNINIYRRNDELFILHSGIFYIDHNRYFWICCDIFYISSNGLHFQCLEYILCNIHSDTYSVI